MWLWLRERSADLIYAWIGLRLIIGNVGGLPVQGCQGWDLRYHVHLAYLREIAESKYGCIYIQLVLGSLSGRRPRTWHRKHGDSRNLSRRGMIRRIVISFNCELFSFA